MVTRYIDALDGTDTVVATHTETDDSVMSWDIPTIFPGLNPGDTYNFVMRTPETAGYAVPVAPSITGIPTISGVATIGQTLTATPAGVTGTPTPTRTWQWERNGAAITGAVSDTYTLVEADDLADITVVQTETNIAGTDSAESNPTSIGYNPSTDLTGYLFSIDPSVIGTLYTDTAGTVPVSAPGDLVACARDPFTNDIVGTQATSGNRPIYQVDTEGFPYLQMHDGTTNRWLATATLPFGTNSINRVLVVAAVEVTSVATTSADFLRLGTGFSNFFRMQIPGGAAANIDVISNGGVNQTANGGASIGTPPDKIVGSFYTSIPSDLIRVRADGIQKASKTGDQGTGTYGNAALGIGGRPDTGGGMRGRLYGLVLAVSATTDFVDADIEPVEAYLDAKLNP